jgi:hypothetical protein
MRVNGRRVDLEIQVADENDYPERSLLYWAREYSSALPEGGACLDLPDVIIISILDFRLFNCESRFSRFQALEVTRHELLASKLDLRYYEPGKLSEANSSCGELKLFKAKTEAELRRLEEMDANRATGDSSVQASRRVSRVPRAGAVAHPVRRKRRQCGEGETSPHFLFSRGKLKLVFKAKTEAELRQRRGSR